VSDPDAMLVKVVEAPRDGRGEAVSPRELEERVKLLETALGPQRLRTLERKQATKRLVASFENEPIKPKYCTVCLGPLKQHEGRGRPNKTCSKSCAKKRQRALIQTRTDKE